MLRELTPTTREIDDVEDAVWAEERPDRRWLLANMVGSIDGATTIDGRSGGLGGPSDRAVFHALRSRADVIVVGAGTARAEGYRPPRPAAVDRRAEAGMADRPVVALVTRSLSLDPSAAIFGDDANRPVVVTTSDADRSRRAALAEVADIVEAGVGTVDLAVAVERLAERHGPLVLTEGGPTLLGALQSADLVDEWCLTLGPVAVGGRSDRVAIGPAAHRLPVELARVWQDADELLLRYLRRR